MSAPEANGYSSHNAAKKPQEGTTMSWRKKVDLGHDLVCQAHDLLRVDDSWLEEDHSSWTYWASDLAQRVWTDTGLFHNGSTVYRLHSEIDLFRARGKPELYESQIEKEMDASSLSAVIYDEVSDTFRMHSSVYACEENSPWLKKLFFAAVALQNAEAHRIVPKLSASLHAISATSAHPVRGIRSAEDPNLAHVLNFFQPLGVRPSIWTGVAEWHQTESTMDREADHFETNHQTRLTAHFPWHAGPRDDMRVELVVDCEEPHPELGNGLHFTLTVPLKMTPDHVARLALEMNLLERKEWKRCHMLGSWCNHLDTLAFRCFVPNSLYHADILPEMSITMAVRAQWANEFFYEKKLAAAGAHH